MDAHHHLWDPADPGQGWLDADGHAVLRRRFTADDLRAAAAGGVDGRTLHASVVVQSINNIDETRRLLATAAGDPMVLGVVGWVDLTGDVVRQLDHLRSGPGGELLVGVRHLVQDEPNAAWLLRKDVQHGLQVLVGEGFAFDLLVRSAELAVGLEAIRRVPGLRVVLDHAGKPHLRSSTSHGTYHDAMYSWAKQISAMAALEGPMCKLSGLLTETDPDGRQAVDLQPVWQVLLNTFSPQRLMFGSDWPMCLLAATWQQCAEVATDLTSALTASERQAIFADNALQAYTLRSSSPTGTREETPTSALSHPPMPTPSNGRAPRRDVANA